MVLILGLLLLSVVMVCDDFGLVLLLTFYCWVDCLLGLVCLVVWLTCLMGRWLGWLFWCFVAGIVDVLCMFVVR